MTKEEAIRYYDAKAVTWSKENSHHCDVIRKVMNMFAFKEGSDMIDIGCGTGVLLPYLYERKPSSVTELDFSEKMLEYAQAEFYEDNIRYVNQDIFEHKGSYDYAFLFSFYHCVKEKRKLAEKLFEIVKEGGRFVLFFSENQEYLNCLRVGLNNGLTNELDEAEVEANVFREYFLIDKIVDDREMYVISGIRRGKPLSKSV